MLRAHKFDLLVSLYIFGVAAAEYMGAKTFPLLNIGGSINDVIVEVEGKERAKSVIRAGLVVVACIFLFSILAIALPPSARFAAQEAAYDDVFSRSARFSLASLIAFAVAEFTDVAIFSKLREKMRGKALWFRNNASNFGAQLLDTVIFMSLAFYSPARGLSENAVFLFGIILPYWLLKCSMSVIETPLVYAGVRWLKGKNSESGI